MNEDINKINHLDNISQFVEDEQKKRKKILLLYSAFPATILILLLLFVFTDNDTSEMLSRKISNEIHSSINSQQAELNDKFLIKDAKIKIFQESVATELVQSKLNISKVIAQNRSLIASIKEKENKITHLSALAHEVAAIRINLQDSIKMLSNDLIEHRNGYNSQKSDLLAIVKHLKSFQVDADSFHISCEQQKHRRANSDIYLTVGMEKTIKFDFALGKFINLGRVKNEIISSFSITNENGKIIFEDSLLHMTLPVHFVDSCFSYTITPTFVERTLFGLGKQKILLLVNRHQIE